MSKIINDKYETLELQPGTPIKHAVWLLQRYNRQGKYTKARFNGVWLYSDSVTMDLAYKEITGMYYGEFEEVYGIAVIEELIDQIVINKEDE